MFTGTCDCRADVLLYLVQVLGIQMDGQGLVPQALEDTLTALLKQGGKMPQVLYTVPVGQNPTGEQGTHMLT